jgi:hypothetical protein
MPDRNSTNSLQARLLQLWHKNRATASTATSQWLLRSSLLTQPQDEESGFVLPTAVMLTLVVTLTAGALTLRAFNNSSRAIRDTQSRVVYNAATPAIDRARAKIEFLFDASKEPRQPGGAPSEGLLLSMMLNDGRTIKNATAPTYRTGTGSTVDPYTLPDELAWGAANGAATGRLDINADGQPDNAWAYRTDTNGDGTKDSTVVYSITFSTPAAAGADATSAPGSQVLASLTNQQKVTGSAGGPYVRNGPLSNASQVGCSGGGGGRVEDGWFADNNSSAILRKNFQVNAMVIPDTGAPASSQEKGSYSATATNVSFTTLEFQQDREFNRGNKWGAWFRNDLEVFPGQNTNFTWNGAMHTEGSLVAKGDFNAYLISSPGSCLFYPTASEITLKDPSVRNSNGFQGQLIAGNTGGTTSSGDPQIHIYANNISETNLPPIVGLTTANDSLNTTPLIDATLDPAVIQSRNGFAARVGGNNTGARDAAYAGSTLSRRISNKPMPVPYVDDTYRADDRFGPKPTYGLNNRIRLTDDTGASTKTFGAVIPTADSFYTSLVGSGSEIGLDGYWERRARVQGMRIIVGQRLELGNGSTRWGGFDVTPAQDPLYPITAADGTIGSDGQGSKDKQRRAFRDNLSAVQAAAVYHAGVVTTDTSNRYDFPIACVATVAHPGTPATLRRSLNFTPTVVKTASGDRELLTDFFQGRGTNGWEFEPYAGAGLSAKATAFKTDVSNASSPLRTALNNLAQLAGDADGAFAPRTTVTRVTPDPIQTMWGNYSELRATLARLTGGTSYDSLSPADKTNLQTASCTLGMLAYNMARVEEFSLANETGLAALADQLVVLQGGSVLAKFRIESSDAPEAVLSKLRTAAADPGGSVGLNLGDTDASTYTNNPNVRLAELLFTHYQIKRDRENGFAPSTPGTGGSCNAATFTAAGLSVAQASALAKLCGTTAKWPSLFYLFPTAARTLGATAGNPEPYLDTDKNRAASTTASFGVVTPAQIRLRPRKFGATYNGTATGLTNPTVVDSTYEDWELPAFTMANAEYNATQNSVPNRIMVGAPETGGTQTARTIVAIPFIDRVLMNGRERMPVRTLAIDVGMLRRHRPKGTVRSVSEILGGTSTATDTWLPVSGLIYGFREDAVREDAIRRASETVDRKAVDYNPDPDRRPHGFRLVNGTQTKRHSRLLVPDSENYRGLSFFSDQPAYIQGNFNLHQTGGEDAAEVPIEEFNTRLPDTVTPAAFYGRRGDDRNNNFASIANDRWRPSEVLADAVTLLSDSFCDGSVVSPLLSSGDDKPGTLYGGVAATGLLPGGRGCGTSDTADTTGNSFASWLKPTTSTTWSRESGVTTDERSPIGFSRLGELMRGSGNGTAYTDPYFVRNDYNRVQSADKSRENTRINTIVISGIIPSRSGQSYGGLHNFPRLIENWNPSDQQRKLYFSGSFIQLSFSNYATAPYDHNIWDGASNGGEDFQYFRPPARIWGYDVGLQLAAAGPAAARFINTTNNLNEFYTEPAASDPYMTALCKALPDDTIPDTRCPASN